MKVAAIIQARMGSTRLPGKIMKKVLDKTLLEYQIERVKRAKTINQIIVATTTNKKDNPIIELCKQISVPYYRGAEDDVLSRYYEAAKQFSVDVIVRLTSDCPIIDPDIIDKIVNCYLKHQNKYDYISNTLTRTYPRGLDTEVIPYRMLKRAYGEANEPSYREHVTAYIYNNPRKFKMLNVQHDLDESKHRWTVDTKEDFLLIKNIITRLYPINNRFSFSDILNLLKQEPDLFYINSHIEQKKIGM
ncbi:acylneuraminate cytidylyltransferase [Bacillus pseudomycoides]|uniref:Acylneuraminate cytidylyltransferase n=1 Tax=Bacillus pseudomycoides TaxID=64104 RepID=A0AA91VD80_9BACI|nr:MULTISPECIES: glycosyltransferase family protein [Bacillus]PEB51543.1 acylneuraminate cytidylyltransferase [Bacillus sp. AFS098217]PED82010.1 acylneuraminate cytidylyltransferase [Bacillus pseudomycoides]PEU16884.1 acylneuraminate cytidylyltransferase [Bacillus sp. AFS019443]PEU20291.1 acylneuraminate cytidylyltransferase [Bacillus sp. AFS014408]PFW61393.1 acylneuraminate cytidylyltransferase [Bacillus sp. AFS075034]